MDLSYYQQYTLLYCGIVIRIINAKPHIFSPERSHRIEIRYTAHHERKIY